MGTFGFLPSDYGDDDDEEDRYWPENGDAVALFCRVSTQWRAAMSGAYGLDYTAIYPLLDRMDLKKDEWLQLLDDIRVMEDAALAVIHKK